MKPFVALSLSVVALFVVSSAFARGGGHGGGGGGHGHGGGCAGHGHGHGGGGPPNLSLYPSRTPPPMQKRSTPGWRFGSFVARS
jgi:hypothetical protein